MSKLIIGAVALVLISFSSCKSLDNSGSSSFDDSDSPYVKEEPKVKEEVKEEVVEQKIVVKEESVKVIEETNTETFKYYVIIGSFKILDNARNYKNDLSKQGFTPVILENMEGLYRVSIAAYNEEIPSRDKIANIRAQYEQYNDTWLLKRKQ